jgi:hypothetical protein
MSLPFESAQTIYRPSGTPSDYGTGTDGIYRDTHRQQATVMGIVDPMDLNTLGTLSKLLGQDVAYLTGSVIFRAETQQMSPADDLAATPVPADWLLYKGKIFEVIIVKPWDDDFLPSCDHICILKRPQPTGFYP